MPVDVPGGPVDDVGALVAAAQSGDVDAFAALYRTLQPALLRHLRVVAPRDAEDIAAEAWAGVVRDLPGFSGGGEQFRGWIFTIARHRLVDARRGEARRPSTPVAEVPEHAADPAGAGAGTGADPADHVLDRLGVADVVALVRTLPPDQAEAVSLRVLGQLGVAEVAELMDRSAGAVRVLTHRGLRTLAARLGAEPAGGGLRRTGDLGAAPDPGVTPGPPTTLEGT